MTRLIIATLIIGLVAFGIYRIYRYYVPEKLSEAIMEDRIPEYLPEKMKANARAMRKIMDENADEVVAYLDHNEVSVQEVSAFIDDVKYREVETLVKKSKEEAFDDPNEAFDFIKQNFDFGDLPVENFRDDFIEYYDKGKFKLAVTYFEINKDQMQAMFPVVKETLKKMLEEKSESTGK